MLEDGAPGAGGRPGPTTRRGRLLAAAQARGVPLAAILAVAGVAVAVVLLALVVIRIRQVLLLVVVAGFVALLLDPLVLGVQRTGLPGLRRRGVAVAVVFLAALAVFAGLATAFGYPLVDGVTHLLSHLDRTVSAAEHGRGWVGRLVRRYHVARLLKQNAPKLEAAARHLAKPALSLGKGAATALVSFVALVVLVLLLLLEGPRLRRGALALLAPERRGEVERVARSVRRAVTGYMFGNLLTSVIAGLVVALTLVILGLPDALLWGLWVAVVDFLPMVGGLLAGVPTVVFAAIAGGVVQGIVVLVVFVVYSLLENHVLNPVVMAKTVRVSPLLVLLAVLVGAELGDGLGGIFGGLVGTLLAVPLAGAVQVVAVELWHRTDPASEPGTLDPGRLERPEVGREPLP